MPNPSNNTTKEAVLNNIPDIGRVIFSREATWQVVGSQPLLPKQLELVVVSPNDARLLWTSLGASRPSSQIPSRIELRLPKGIMQEMNGWDWKAGILTNFMMSGASSASEPLRTPFLQSLMDRGYQAVNIENATLSDAAMRLHLAPVATLRGVTLQAALTLRCDEITMHAVEIIDSKIEFNVKRSTWFDCKVSGTTSQFTGDMGETTFDENCTFNRVWMNANLTRGRFLGVDTLASRFIGEAESELMPPELNEIMKPMSDEEYQEMLNRLAAGKWSGVDSHRWSATKDAM
jgi:hypothetical protein